MKHLRHETCGKKRYPNESAAISAALRSSRRSGLALRTYSCERCFGWHLTKRATKPWISRNNDPATPLRNETDHRRGCPCSKCAWLIDRKSA